MKRSLSRREFLGTSAAGATAVAARHVLAAQGTPRSPVPVSVFSKHLQYLDYRALAETAAEAGFDGIDLTVRSDGHVVPERGRDDLPKAAEAARAAGIAVRMITTSIVSAADPHARTVLETAAQLGVRDYRLGWIPYDKARGTAGTLESLRSPLRQLAVLNERCGVRGGYQNHAGEEVGGAVWDLWVVLRDVASPWLGCQYDIRHAVIEGGYSWPNALRVIAPFIQTIDIKDGCWERTPKGWQATSVPLGTGAVDFVAFFRLLAELEVSKPISMHFEYPFPETGSTADRRKAAVALMRRDRERLVAAMAEAGFGHDKR
jgi:L-ribulose-5-phosphate 3-epimerase